MNPLLAILGRYELWSDRVRAPCSSRRILIVDDYVDIADTMALVFEHESFVVQTAYSGEQAIEIAKRWRPDIALLDISLPDLTGIEVGAQFRSELSLGETVIIAHTALDIADVRESAKAAKFDAFFGKPTDFRHIIKLLDYLCPQ